MPSLPGYGYSSGPPLDRDYSTEDIARIIDKLMTGLGLDKYISQGGDIGSFVSRVLGATAPACKAVHRKSNSRFNELADFAVNFCQGAPKDENAELSKQEEWGLARAADFGKMGNAYAREHGTRPATIGLVLASSPIALLAW